MRGDRGLCCWCSAPAVAELVHRDGWRDPACRAHADEYGSHGDIRTVAGPGSEGQAPGVLETVCGWCPAPVLVRAGFKVAGPVPDDRPLSHGICLACSARMIAKMPSPGPVVAARMAAEAAAPPVLCRSCERGECYKCKGWRFYPDVAHPSGIGQDPCGCSCNSDTDPDGDFLR